MIPPDWVLEKLEEISPRARLGFAGGDTFAIVELWRTREAPETILPTYNGHVFGRYYDPLAFVPKHVADIDVQDVFNGNVILHVKEWARPFRERAIEQLSEKGKEEDRIIREQAEEAGKELYWRAQRSPHRGPMVANKHLTQEDKEILSGEYNAHHSLEDFYMPDMTRPENPIK